MIVLVTPANGLPLLHLWQCDFAPPLKRWHLLFQPRIGVSMERDMLGQQNHLQQYHTSSETEPQEVVCAFILSMSLSFSLMYPSVLHEPALR